jgi:uncharacterized RDD family membrane protein YckC
MTAEGAGVVESADMRDYASWLRRLTAFALDWLLLSILPGVILGGFIIAAGTLDPGEELYAVLDTIVLGVVLAALVVVVSSTLYFTLCVGRSGQTVGKRAVRIAIRDAEDVAQPIGYGRALARWFVTAILWFLYSVPAVVDHLWPLWDKRNQSLHDKAARSVVIRV